MKNNGIEETREHIRKEIETRTRLKSERETLLLGGSLSKEERERGEKLIRLWDRQIKELNDSLTCK